MRFGIFVTLGQTSWEEVLRLVKHAEATGWDAACVTDHFMPNIADPAGDVLECWSILAAIAAVVPRIRIGTIVSGNTYRHPALLAKMATTVDIISGGRLIAGIGAGWQRNEHEAYGIPFYSPGERLARLDEACQILKSLWTQPTTTFAGRYYRLQDAPLMPKPVQRPHPELMIGGGGEKVTLRIAAKHADHWNVLGGPSILTRKSGILEAHCAAVGRNPKTIVRSASMPLLIAEDRAEATRLVSTFMQRYGVSEETARDSVLAGSVGEIRDKLTRLSEIGVGMVFVQSMFFPQEPRPMLDRFVGEIAPAFRSP